MTQPELEVLREADHEDLIAAELDMRTATTGEAKRRPLAKQDLLAINSPCKAVSVTQADGFFTA